MGMKKEGMSGYGQGGRASRRQNTHSACMCMCMCQSNPIPYLNLAHLLEIVLGAADSDALSLFVVCVFLGCL